MIRLASLLFSILAPVWLVGQRLRGRITPQEARNLMGRATVPVPDRPVIWVHGASLGELTAIRPVLSHLARRHADHAILVTANNPRALAVVAGWDDLETRVQLAPLDLAGAVRRFFATWRPVAFINVESELWPRRFAKLAAEGVPSIFINARLSDRSLRLLRRIGAGGLHLGHFRHFFAQSAATTANLRALGIASERIETTPNLKSLVDLPEPHPLGGLLPARACVLLAASTHATEEAAVLCAFDRLRQRIPQARLILSPRHPHRTAEVAELVARAGYEPLLLSRAAAPVAQTQVVLADRLGVQPALYPLAAVTFVGGSLPRDIGGHTPYEPVRARSAVVSGPHVANFAAEYATLRAAGACRILPAPDDLAGGLAAGRADGLAGDLAGDLADALIAAFADADRLAARATAALPDPGEQSELFARISGKLGL